MTNQGIEFYNKKLEQIRANKTFSNNHEKLFYITYIINMCRAKMGMKLLEFDKRWSNEG